MINTLLVFKDEVFKKNTIEALKAFYLDQVKVITIPTLQEAIEHLEINKSGYDLIVFEQRSNSITLSKVLYSLGNGAKFISCDDVQSDTSILPEDYIIESIALLSIPVELPKIIKKFEALGYLVPITGIKDEYISVKPEIMVSYCPLNYNVFIKMGDGRFVRLFNKGDPIEKADFERYQKEKGIELFYFKKSEYQEVLEKTASKLERITNTVPLPEAVVIQEAIKSHAIVKDFIQQVGFTSEAQLLARSSVAMTAKLMGSHPKLSKILSDLKKKDGNYVSSHSISLGTLSCAIAHKLEWNSAATYFKLSLAAFIHDITLSDKLAKINHLSQANKEEFTSEEINKIKLHPIHGADYVRRMSAIPADVDQIVFQHHEQPDGSGFPRGLVGKFVSPLSSVFIIAHAIIEFMIKREGESIETFLKENEELYRHGNFRKIWLALKTDTK